MKDYADVMTSGEWLTITELVWGKYCQASDPALILTFYYPRATRCGGDIVTLLWFRACVCASVRPCVDLVNTIVTKPLHISLSNLADMLTGMRG